MPTLREYREEVARALGGFVQGTVTVDPDIEDPLGQRSILSADVFDLENGSKSRAGEFVYVPKYRDDRRVRENGYRTLAYAAYEPPTSGTYNLAFYGAGVVGPIDWDATPLEVAAAISASGISGISATEVSGDGHPMILRMPDVIDVDIDNGEMLASGGIGALELNRALTKPAFAGDYFEVSPKLPARDGHGFQGLNTVINMALRRLWFIGRFPITPGPDYNGQQTFHGLSDNKWLYSQSQIISLYDPAEWRLSATFDPPVSGSYNLELDMGIEQHTTYSLAFDATPADVQAALQQVTGLPIVAAAIADQILIVLPRTFYALPTLRATAGTITSHTRRPLWTPSRSLTGWGLQFGHEGAYIENFIGNPGESFYVSGFRQGHSWIAPQLEYGVMSENWAPGNGLVNDFDQAKVEINDLVPVAYWYACRQLASVGPANEVDHWKREALKAAGVAASVKWYDMPFENKARGSRSTPNAAGNGSKGYWGRW